MQRRRKRKNSSKGFKILLLIVIACCIGIICKQEYQIYEINKEKDATAARIEKLNQVKQNLEQEKQNLSDPEYIEKLARDEYNMVKQGEIPVFVVEEKQETLPQKSSK